MSTSYLNSIQTIQLLCQLLFHEPNARVIISMFHSAIIPTFLLALIQPKSHLRGWTQSTTPSPPYFSSISSSICPLLSSVILPLSPLKQHSSISLPSHPLVRNLQFILCPLVLPSLLSVILRSVYPSIHPSIHLPLRCTLLLLACSLSSVWQCCRLSPIIPAKVVPTSIHLTQPHTISLDVIWHDIMSSMTRMDRHTLYMHIHFLYMHHLLMIHWYLKVQDVKKYIINRG